MASANKFFTNSEKDAIVTAIRKVEIHTSGEIRVHVDDRCDENAYDRAVKVFQYLKMDKTIFRNGVLIYIAVKDRKFAIIGDEGIYKKVDDSFWSAIAQKLHIDFEAQHFAHGIIHAIDTVGATLINYFPNLDELERNELPDDISFE